MILTVNASEATQSGFLVVPELDRFAATLLAMTAVADDGRLQ